MSRSWTGIPELREAHRQLGPLRFWSLMIGLLAFIGGWAAIGMWLELQLGWPDAYGFRCHGRGCWIDDLWHSPSLLGGNLLELGLFVWIWSLPAILVGAFIYARVKKRSKRTIFSSDSTE